MLDPPLGIVNSDGLTPLVLAVYGGDKDIVKYLIIECGVNVNGRL